jgi:cytidine deaminase
LEYTKNMEIAEYVWERLAEAAMTARKTAYAPYSQFQVGAALLAGDAEQIYRGANVENISLGLTMCAERVALGAAIVHGARELRALTIVAESTEPIVPCGACRQVLAEFSPALVIRSLALPSRAAATFTLTELLPRPRQGILDREGKGST